jgi:hypothetical protein
MSLCRCCRNLLYPNPQDLEGAIEKISDRFPDVFIFTDRAGDGIAFAFFLSESCAIVKTIKGEANTLQSLGDLLRAEGLL